MPKDNLIDLKKPEPFIDDPITDVLRQGARKLLAEALEAEIEGFLSQYAYLKDEQGRQRVTRNGHLPERNIQTGIGPVPVKVPRCRDRQPGDEPGPVRFNSTLIPPYLRKTKSEEPSDQWNMRKIPPDGAQ